MQALRLTPIFLLLNAALALAEPAVLEGVVNINTATPSELELLPGVGPAKAARIVAYRQRHPFRTIEELARVKGIGPKTVRRLRLNLVVRGPTTAQEPTRRRRDPDAISAAGPARKETTPPAAPAAPPAAPSAPTPPPQAPPTTAR
jgi:competence protein ComEA